MKKEESNSSLEKYIEEIKKYPTLTDEEVRYLFEKIEDGDEKAKKKVAESYLKLVYQIAIDYENRGMDFTDVIHEGNVGLLKSLDKYDRTKDYTFEKYATWWIKQAITRAIADHSKIIRIPNDHPLSPSMKMKQMQRKLQTELNREPSYEEVMEAFQREKEEKENKRKNEIQNMLKKIDTKDFQQFVTGLKEVEWSMKKEAYILLFYRLMLDLRSDRFGNEKKYVYALGDYLHNLPLFIAKDFQEFDEELFWYQDEIGIYEYLQLEFVKIIRRNLP